MMVLYLVLNAIHLLRTYFYPSDGMCYLCGRMIYHGRRYFGEDGQPNWQRVVGAEIGRQYSSFLELMEISKFGILWVSV